MRLTDDQRALLKLLLEQGQSYDDIAALLGIEKDEARERARAALAEMAGEDPDADVAITDYLLGQADSIAKADVERHLAGDPNAQRLASKLEMQLRLLAPSTGAPAAGRPTPPKRVPPAPEPAPEPKPTRPSAPKLKLPKAPSLPSVDRRLAAAAAGGLLLIVLGVLLATGTFGGDDGGGDGGENAGRQPATANGGPQQPTRAVLRPVGDQDAVGGVALFGRTRNTPAIRVEATGLEPSPAGSSYMLWLYRSPSLALRFGRVQVGQDGRLAVQVAIPTEALALVAAGTFDAIDVSLASDDAYQAEQRRANQAGQPPRYVGDSVLRGSITGPLVRRAANGNGG